MKKKTANQYREELLGNILTDIDKEIDDKEIIRLLSERKISSNKANRLDENFGARLADSIASFAGSWTFILIFIGVLLSWMILNIFLLKNKGFDPYPFILLNLVLSCVAAIQAPLIMMSQNRQETKDRARGENDYKVNLKSEFIMGEILTKLDIMAAEQDRIEQTLDELVKMHSGEDGK